MSAAKTSVHNIVWHNRYIYLSKYPSVEWVPNLSKVASAYGPKLGLTLPPCHMIGFSQSLREGGREKLVVKQWTQLSQDKVL